MGRKAFYAVVLCALIAGVNGLLIKYMSSMTAGSIAWFRTMIPIVVLAPGLFAQKSQLFRGNYKKMLLASSINAFRIYLYLIAFIYTSIGNAVVLFYSWPIFVSIIGIIFLKEKIKQSHLLLLLTAFAGLILTYADKSFSFENRDFIGMVAALFAAIGYAATVVIFKSETHNSDKNEMIFYQNIISAIIFIPFLTALPEAHLEHIGVAVVYAVLIGVVVYKLFFFGLKYLPASTASSLMYLEVVSAIILSYFILQESLEWNTIVGACLILGSSFFISRLGKLEK